MWRTSEAFSDADRAALAFTDAIVTGDVPPAVTEELTRHFDESQRVELTVTAAFYSMVPARARRARRSRSRSREEAAPSGR